MDFKAFVEEDMAMGAFMDLILANVAGADTTVHHKMLLADTGNLLSQRIVVQLFNTRSANLFL